MTTTDASGEPAELRGLRLLADAAVVVEADGTISYANPMALRLVSRPADKVLGRPASQVLHLQTEDAGDWWADHRPLDCDPARLPRISEQELTLLVDQHSRPVSLTGARLAGEDGTTARLLLTIRRADARKRRDAARADLVSTVSHELRSPLTSVKGFTKTLLAKWDRFTDEQKKQMLATVNEDADRVTRLLGELLAVSRIDAGRLQLKRQMIDVAAIADALAGKLSTAHGRAITVDADGGIPELYADADRVEQILSNLLENACRYTDGPVEVLARELDEVVEVTVIDHGPGIEPEYHRAVFGKFFRTPGQKKQGTGLGLYITRGLVLAHGGEIDVTSEHGQGTRFRFTLPKGGLELAGIDVDALRATTTPG